MMMISIYQDKWTKNKQWIIKKYKSGHFYMNQLIGGRVKPYHKRFSRTNQKSLESIGVLKDFELVLEKKYEKFKNYLKEVKMNFKAGDMVIYSDPTDFIGATGVYIIDSIKGDQVKLSPMCGRLKKLTTKISQIEKP